MKITSADDEEDDMFLATVFNVMIASSGNVSSERQVIRDVIFSWNAINPDHRNTVLLPGDGDTFLPFLLIRLISLKTHTTPTYDLRSQEHNNH